MHGQLARARQAPQTHIELTCYGPNYHRTFGRIVTVEISASPASCRGCCDLWAISEETEVPPLLTFRLRDGDLKGFCECWMKRNLTCHSIETEKPIESLKKSASLPISSFSALPQRRFSADSAPIIVLARPPLDTKPCHGPFHSSQSTLTTPASQGRPSPGSNRIRETPQFDA